MITRRLLGLGAGALIFTAAEPARADAADDMSIGVANAPLQLVEYASSTCSHCAHFHETNWAQLKSAYIDTGRVRLTLREFLTAPPPLSFALFQLARCGNADGAEYFRRLGIIFDRQRAIFDAAQAGQALPTIIALGAEWGLTEPQIRLALDDENGRARVMRSIEAGNAAGVTGTPSFFLNGQRLDANFATPEGMTTALDAALAR